MLGEVRMVAYSQNPTGLSFFLQGGFARVYEVHDPRGVRSAVKVIVKQSLKTKKAKTKVR